MNLRKIVTSGLISTLVLVVAVGSALASESLAVRRVSQRFDDMVGFERGLSQVTRMQALGVLRGQEEHRFAPGAKVTRQEAVLATVRFMEAEAEAQALGEAEVEALLKDIPDGASIALWARPATALLVLRGTVNPMAEFDPAGDATRLEVSILLVKALGYEAEARASMDAFLPFVDAGHIPAHHVGYVATALKHRLISGYEDNTFRPGQGVKRIELATMLGRVQIRRIREFAGTVKSVDAAGRALTISSADGSEIAAALSDDAAVFLDGVEVSIAGLRAGMLATVTLNPTGKAVVVAAKNVQPSPPVQGIVITGEIVALCEPIPGSPGVPARVSLGIVADGSFTMSTYDIPESAAIVVNGQSAGFADLLAGDTASLTLIEGAVTLVEVNR